MSEAIARTSQSLAVGDLVNLYQLDLTPIGQADVLYFTESVMTDGSHISFGGVSYAPINVQTEGWEISGQGQFPRPTIRLSNVADFLSGLLYAYNDLVGAKFTRVRTYRQFLDGQPGADPTAYYAPDVFRVEQKTAQTKSLIEFQLAAATDQQGVQLPRRQIFRDTCTHRYRIAKSDGTFDYAKATCPYTGNSYFDPNGNIVTDPTKDQCGFRLSDCKLRFPNQPLPTRAFPGVVRTTVQ